MDICSWIKFLWNNCRLETNTFKMSDFRDIWPTNGDENIKFHKKSHEYMWPIFIPFLWQKVYFTSIMSYNAIFTARLAKNCTKVFIRLKVPKNRTFYSGFQEKLIFIFRFLKTYLNKLCVKNIGSKVWALPGKLLTKLSDLCSNPIRRQFILFGNQYLNFLS